MYPCPYIPRYSPNSSLWIQFQTQIQNIYFLTINFFFLINRRRVESFVYVESMNHASLTSPGHHQWSNHFLLKNIPKCQSDNQPNLRTSSKSSRRKTPTDTEKHQQTQRNTNRHRETLPERHINGWHHKSTLTLIK